MTQSALQPGPSLNMRNRIVSVIGAGRSGMAAARVLTNLGARVLLSDSQTADLLGKERLDYIASTGIPFIAGASVGRALPDDVDLVVTSPGVWRTTDVLREAAARSIPVWSEIELAFRISPARIIATTGTNGKTTTTLLISDILRRAGIDAVAAGNISADEIKKTLVESAYEAFAAGASDRVLIAEISSFQLEWVDRFAPWIGLLLNVTPDHMNRHADFDEYFSTKARLFAQQVESDWALMNFDDDAIRSNGFPAAHSRGVWISTACRPRSNSPQAYLQDGAITVELCPNRPVPIMPVSDIPETLPGSHSVFNILAASAAASIAGVDPKLIAAAIREFRGVPHRMEVVANINGVRFINNSMCTNAASFVASLKAIGRPAIVIAGGADKAMEFSQLTDPLKQFARQVVLIGTAADKMEAAFRAGGYNALLRAGSLEEAVEMAAGSATFGQAVVLSPGCASFDMFRDFEARGAAFRAAVRMLPQDRQSKKGEEEKK